MRLAFGPRPSGAVAHLVVQAFHWVDVVPVALAGVAGPHFKDHLTTLDAGRVVVPLVVVVSWRVLLALLAVVPPCVLAGVYPRAGGAHDRVDALDKSPQVRVVCPLACAKYHRRGLVGLVVVLDTLVAAWLLWVVYGKPRAGTFPLPSFLWHPPRGIIMPKLLKGEYPTRAVKGGSGFRILVALLRVGVPVVTLVRHAVLLWLS